MSEANKQLMRRWFERVWNQKNEAAIDEMFSSDGRSHGFPEPDSVLLGPDGFKQIHRSFCGAFPDAHITVEDVIAEGDKTAVRWSVTMTHLGDHLGFKCLRENRFEPRLITILEEFLGSRLNFAFSLHAEHAAW